MEQNKDFFIEEGPRKYSIDIRFDEESSFTVDVFKDTSWDEKGRYKIAPQTMWMSKQELIKVLESLKECLNYL
jgi:hypothetical protein